MCIPYGDGIGMVHIPSEESELEEAGYSTACCSCVRWRLVAFDRHDEGELSQLHTNPNKIALLENALSTPYHHGI